MLASLKEANGLFSTSATQKLGAGDLLYAGNTAKWKKLCNSLRLRMAIRIFRSRTQPCQRPYG